MSDEFKRLVERAYAMMGQAGYRVAAHDPEHNNPIVAWMSDARAALDRAQSTADRCPICGALDCKAPNCGSRD